jgi:hypothetical protein
MKKKWLLGFMLLPLVGVSLLAQEPATEDTPAPTEEQQPEAAGSPAADKPDNTPPRQPDQPEERVSADNNLSFPVDI